jgi:hypothetical protein
MRSRLPRELVLAIAPSTRGVAYTCFEGPLSPVDWGLKRARGKNKNVEGFKAVSALVERLQPDVIVLHEYTLPGVRRSQRVRRLQHLIATYAHAQAIEVRRYTRKDIEKVFKKLGAATRYEIAQVIAGQVHAFGHRLPPPRKLWMTEDPRMTLFEAAALALTYFGERGLLPDEEP